MMVTLSNENLGIFCIKFKFGDTWVLQQVHCKETLQISNFFHYVLDFKVLTLSIKILLLPHYDKKGILGHFYKTTLSSSWRGIPFLSAAFV